MEGRAAEAGPEAAAEHRESRRGSLGEASPPPGAQQGRIDRRVSSAMPTSRAAPLAEVIAVVIDALAPSRLQFHLAITSRIVLLLWKGHESAH